jgi:phage gpG-like protein
MAIVTAKNRRAIARLRAISKAIEQMPPEMLGAVHKTVGKRVRSLISEGFKTESAPDGERWAKRTKRKPWAVLDNTGKMKRAWRVTGDNRGIYAKNKDPKTRFHQFGTRNMVARPMVPRKGQRLPERWRVSILRSAKNAVGKELAKVLSP